MKKSLLLLASMLMSVGVFAQWVKPVPEFTEFAENERLYLYNVEAGGFLLGANDWNTRASVSPTLGHMVKLQPQYEDPEAVPLVPLGTYVLADSVLAGNQKGKWDAFDCQSFDGIWADGTEGGGNYRKGWDTWRIEQSGDYYILTNDNVKGGNFGVAEYVDGKTGNTRTWILDATKTYTYTENDETFTDPKFSGGMWDKWAFVTPEVYDAFIVKAANYEAAVALKKTIDEAQELDAEHDWSRFTDLYANTEAVAADLSAEEKVLKAYMDLKKALDEAKAGEYSFLDFNEPETAYNTKDLTEDDVKAAKSQIADIINNYKANQASFDEPFDFTSAIGGATPAAFEPWVQTFTGTGTQGDKARNTWSTEANNGGDGTNMLTPFLQIWKPSGTLLSDQKITQTLRGAAPGLYQFKANVRLYNEKGDVDALTGGSMFFGDNTVTLDEQVEMYKKNNKCVLWNRNGFNIIAIVEEGGDIEFGFEFKNATFNWMSFKDVSLLYYGNKDVEANALKLKKASYNLAKVDAEETAASESYINAYNAGVDKFDACAEEEIPTVAAEVEKLRADLDENITAYADLYKKMNEWVEDFEGAGYQGEKADIFSDYIQFGNDDFDFETYADYPMPTVYNMMSDDAERADKYPFETTEALKAYTHVVDSLYKDMVVNCVAEGGDCTTMLANPSFETGDFTGWTTNGKGKLGNKNVEYFEQVVDAYQSVKAPAGVYSVSVQAFERPGGNGSYTGDEAAKVFLYMNNLRTPVQNIVKDAMPKDKAVSASYVGNNVQYDGTGNAYFLKSDGTASSDWPYDYFMTDKGYVPNSVDGARIAFEAGRYVQSCYGLVEDEGEGRGTMKIGLTSDGTKLGSGGWVLFANFKLTYEGKNPAAVATVLQAKHEDLNAFLEKNTGKMSTDVELAVNNVLIDTEGVTEDDDRDFLWNQLTRIISVAKDAEANVSAFAAVDNATSDLLDIVSIVESTTDYNIFETEAWAAYEEIKDGVEDYFSLTTEQLEAFEKKVKEVTEALKEQKLEFENEITAAEIAGATDADPKDATGFIRNPSYENNNSESWTGSSPAWGDAVRPSHDGYNRKDMVEVWRNSFDAHQKLVALPAGTYELSVQCYSRYNDNAGDDLKALEEGRKGHVQAAIVYAQVGSDIYAEPFRLVSESASPNTSDYASRSEATSAVQKDETEAFIKLYTPNNMASAGARFDAANAAEEAGEPWTDDKAYRVRVVFTLDAAGDVIIGVKNDRTTDWNIWDNWKLTYFGTESAKENSSTAIESVAAAKTFNGKYMENGRIVIVKNGVKYNVAGQMVK